MTDENKQKSVQALEKCPSIEASSKRLRRSITRDQETIRRLESELRVSGPSLVYLDKGLAPSTADRVSRLLQDQPRFERRVIDCLNQINAVLKDETRQADSKKV